MVLPAGAIVLSANKAVLDASAAWFELGAGSMAGGRAEMNKIFWRIRLQA
jgi:hypothetical protein